MDYWSEGGFEIRLGKNEYGGMEILSDGSLEFNVCDGMREDWRDGREHANDATIVIPPDRAPEVLAGIQAWIEQL